LVVHPESFCPLAPQPRLVKECVADVEKDGPNDHGQRWTMERETRDTAPLPARKNEIGYRLVASA
jgi:hypothetical protein